MLMTTVVAASVDAVTLLVSSGEFVSSADVCATTDAVTQLSTAVLVVPSCGACGVSAGSS